MLDVRFAPEADIKSRRRSILQLLNADTHLLSADPDEMRRLTETFEAMERGSTDRGQFVARLVAAVNAPENQERKIQPSR